MAEFTWFDSLQHSRILTYGVIYAPFGLFFCAGSDSFDKAQGCWLRNGLYSSGKLAVAVLEACCGSGRRSFDCKTPREDFNCSGAKSSISITKTTQKTSCPTQCICSFFLLECCLNDPTMAHIQIRGRVADWYYGIIMILDHRAPRRCEWQKSEPSNCLRCDIAIAFCLFLDTSRD